MENTYAIIGREPGPYAARALRALEGAIRDAGWRAVDADSAALVLHVIDPERPVTFRRRARSTYVAAVCELPAGRPQLADTYPLLVRSLSNIVLCATADGTWFTTMERGFYLVDDASLVEHLLPLAGSKLVIDNEFRTDLEPELWGGDHATESIRAAGRAIEALGLLPAPFPIEDLLDERDLRHVKLLYGIGGLSYGNLSARRDAERFWMSASGVDKANLDRAGRDILLVSGYDPDRGVILLSVPPVVEPRRVSVDAIEHWMIYRQHPEVGAILHVHGWIDGIRSTHLNFPCGSEELALAVSAALAREPDPVHAVIGLHNHGITATGESLPEILERIGSMIRPQVPMSG
ncbi:MAG TPA: class II aldolase/adducin family protein [Gaiellaceae bacterium]|nr:class II aldolase/adducin family protein [Gaiellaceae bacterium]